MTAITLSHDHFPTVRKTPSTPERCGSSPQAASMTYERLQRMGIGPHPIGVSSSPRSLHVAHEARSWQAASFHPSSDCRPATGTPRSADERGESQVPRAPTACMRPAQRLSTTSTGNHASCAWKMRTPTKGPASGFIPAARNARTTLQQAI